jgi:hypothetical protein
MRLKSALRERAGAAKVASRVRLTTVRALIRLGLVRERSVRNRGYHQAPELVEKIDLARCSGSGAPGAGWQRGGADRRRAGWLRSRPPLDYRPRDRRPTTLEPGWTDC